MPRPRKTPVATTPVKKPRKPRTPSRYPAFMKKEDRPAWEAQQEAKRLAEENSTLPPTPSVVNTESSNDTETVIMPPMPEIPAETNVETGKTLSVTLTENMTQQIETNSSPSKVSFIYAGVCSVCSTTLYQEGKSGIVRCKKCGYTRVVVA